MPFVFKFALPLAPALATLVSAAVYFAISPLALSRLVLYQPARTSSYDTVPLQALGATGQEVTFATASGHNIHGFYYNKPGATHTVLLHHGQGGNLGSHIGLARTMLLAGCSVLIYDYEGFGKSPGAPSTQAMLRDSNAAYDFLVATKHTHPQAIIHCGVSLGTGVASNLAARRPSAGVILISPYTSLRQIATERLPLYRIYPRFLFPQPDLGSLEFMSTNSTVPVLLIHGAADPLIGVHHAKQLHAASRYPCQLVIDSNAHHGDFSTTFLAHHIHHFLRRLPASPITMITNDSHRTPIHPPIYAFALTNPGGSIKGPAMSSRAGALMSRTGALESAPSPSLCDRP